MKIIKSKKFVNINFEEFNNSVNNFDEVVLDLGCGDGKFIVHNALKNPKTFYIGLDPSQKSLQKLATEINKRKINNALIISSSVEQLPEELFHKVDTVFVLFPWGSLLGFIINLDFSFFENIKKLLRKPGGLIIIFGYSSSSEPSETQRLNLVDIDEDFIKSKLIPGFEAFGFNLCSITHLDAQSLKDFPTSWSKKLAFGRKRPFYKVELSI